MAKKYNFHKLHKEKWQWHYDNPMESTDSWPMLAKYRNIQCFPCEVGRRQDSWLCISCPIGDCLPHYIKWLEAKTPKIRKKYAAIIRDLPWKGEKMYEL